MRYIAEIGSNWKVTDNDGENWVNLVKLINRIEEFNPDYIKFQIWDTDKFIHPEHPSYDSFKRLEMPREYYAGLIDLLGNRFMASVFDEATADTMNALGQTNWKIASGDITHLSLIKHIAKFNQPMFLSTGNANEYEIKQAVDTITNVNDQPLTIFHCVSKYPIELSEMGLKRLRWLVDTYGTKHSIGWSSHLEPFDADAGAITAMMMGADTIEVHVGDSGTPDACVSLNPSYFGVLKITCNEIQQSINADPLVNEEELCWARRGTDGLRPWIDWQVRDDN